jgi:HEAT repeat protein
MKGQGSQTTLAFLLKPVRGLMCILLIPWGVHTWGQAIPKDGRTNALPRLSGTADGRLPNSKAANGSAAAFPKIIVPSGAFGPGTSTEDLIAGLKSKDVSTRVDAIRALWREDRPAARLVVPLLIESLGTNAAPGDFTSAQRSRLRAEAAVTLGLIGPEARAAVLALVRVLEDPDEWARANAAEALGRIAPADPQVLPGLIKAMRDPSIRVQYAANRAVLTAGPVNLEVTRGVIRAMRDHGELFKENRSEGGPSGNIASISEEFFFQLGPEQRFALADLVELAKDPHPGIQRIAFIGLNGVGEIPEEFVPILEDALPDEVAVAAIRMMGPKAKAAVPRIMAAMESERDRFIAAELLAAIGNPAAKPAIPMFTRFINEAPYPELYLCEDLLKIDPSSTVALTGFEKITGAPQKSLPDTLNGLVAHARLFQGGRDPQAHLRFLADKLRDREESVRACAAKLVLDCNAQNPTRTNALDRIFQLMETGTNEWAVSVAEQALEDLGSTDKLYVPHLLRLLGRYPSLSVLTALGRIGPEARDALPRVKLLLLYQSESGGSYRALHESLDPESAAVRKVAQETIRKIEGDRPAVPR